MKPFSGKLALVTGASSGIGAVIALRLAREGLRVALTARREPELNALAARIRSAGGQAHVFAADLALPEQRAALAAAVRGLGGAPDVLVNNAGFGYYGWHDRLSWPEAQAMLRVNVEAAAHLSLLFLPEMRARAGGRIINVGSVAGDIPSQGVALYSASKSFLSAFSTGLARELRGSGVHVSVLKPGPVKTPFFDAAQTIANGRPVPLERVAVPAEQVADAVWSLLRRPRRVAYVPGWLAVVPWVELWFAWLMDRLGPLHLASKGE